MQLPLPDDLFFGSAYRTVVCIVLGALSTITYLPDFSRLGRPLTAVAMPFFGDSATPTM